MVMVVTVAGPERHEDRLHALERHVEASEQLLHRGVVGQQQTLAVQREREVADFPPPPDAPRPPPRGRRPPPTRRPPRPHPPPPPRAPPPGLRRPGRGPRGAAPRPRA